MKSENRCHFEGSRLSPAGQINNVLDVIPTGAVFQAEGGTSLQVRAVGDPSLRLKNGCAQDDAWEDGLFRARTQGFTGKP